ncbi:hypothetical protein OLX02_18635 [Novosphingobium sp. KCTC 2891]|uniref:hypothetical protein n=1 Tax=Novosphingobium sp. KCTC 2891 TaxID=2989730 RepID=UPI0022234ABA|nr:hypothetical protein [Novosphingobium sp. KCTC 2891]MCW1384838.1 hypothetical protein [Novosphingobium sp. KCTC 2891]
MRLLLVLLAMLTGLSLPDVAVATSRAEVAGVGVSASAATQAAARRTVCPVRAKAAPPRKFAALQRKPIWLPTAALVENCGVRITDRARE